ncbi:hypothetical protein DFH07DRAFT_783922 [Mycena maculata]|uniref:Uncharacterized protein n=1 Tax=Mycena maculata TaxID=230809 RepID=A0AAD7HJF3_9AGAR|nr:hypothetical protein DFH07DRAFT_783922 [Mycena maculata]
MFVGIVSSLFLSPHLTRPRRTLPASNLSQCTYHQVPCPALALSSSIQDSLVSSSSRLSPFPVPSIQMCAFPLRPMSLSPSSFKPWYPFPSCVYESHFKSLEEFKEHTEKYKLLGRILLRMHNVGRYHSGVQPIATVTTSTLSKEVLDAALREYEEDQPESDGDEDGELSDVDMQE